MQKNKLDKNIEANPFSASSQSVISALNTIKEKGNTGYLPLLFNLLKSNPEEEIETQIVFILNNLKTKNAVTVLAEAIQNPDYKSIRKILTMACWQNGLDFKEYLPVFVEMVINEEWELGFEAFTVIENMENYPNHEIINLTENKIHKALKDAGEQKKYFLHEILKLIR